jgi:hypothetical protein
MERNYHSLFNQVINYISVLPYLYRYENENFIEDFFINGNLFISSFQNYRSYEDNELGDKSEGHSLNIGVNNSNMNIGSYSISGFNEFSFCTSTILKKDLFEKFSRNSVFRIKDPINFILEISKSLTRVIEVYHGNCIYVDNKIISKNIGDFSFENLEEPDGNISADKLFSISNQVQGLDSFFLKDRKYQEQSEYRIL